MKLLSCKKCHDVFVLQEHRIRTCECGECSGRYTKSPNAVYTGDGIIIVIDNNTLKTRYQEMMNKRPDDTIMNNLLGKGQIGCFIMQPGMPNFESIRKLSPMEKM